MKKLVLLLSIVLALTLAGCKEKPPAQSATPFAPPIDQIATQPGEPAPLPPEDADPQPVELPLANVDGAADASQSEYTPVVPVEAPAEEMG